MVRVETSSRPGTAHHEGVCAAGNPGRLNAVAGAVTTLEMVSKRLRYAPVTPATLDAFHMLVQDAHVRRYLMDGHLFPREWSEARIHDSAALFERQAIGLWLAYGRTSGALVGFCGFLEFPAVHPEPELVYALLERYSSRGYATEMARASIAHARTRGGLCDILTSVDEVNRASLRVLEKLGFERCGSRPGAFGRTLLLRLAGPPTDLRRR
jgi:ribosomal-protein-alanine N-acetyltransferase